VLTNLDEGRKAVLVPKKQDIGEVAFGESLCGRRVDALDFTGETQRGEISFVETRMAADLCD